MVDKLGLMDLSSFEEDLSMLVKEPIIDEQHKNLFLKLNSLIRGAMMDDVVAVKEAFHFLDGYYDSHFKYEEKYMESINYPYSSAHKKIHRQFLKKFDVFRRKFEKLSKGKINSNKLKQIGVDARKNQLEWLKNHIRTEDQKYALFLISKNKQEFLKSEKNKKIEELKRKNEEKQEELKDKKEKEMKIKKELKENLKLKKELKERKSNIKIKPIKEKENLEKNKEDKKEDKIKENKPKEVEKIKEKDKKEKFDMASIKAEIDEQLKKQRAPVADLNIQENSVKTISSSKKSKGDFIKTGISGMDQLFENGIPRGNSVIIAGGAGSGKTIFCLQTLAYHAARGEKCFYMSFEESEDRLTEHMNKFGWDAKKLMKSGNLKIARYSPFDITRSVDAMLAKEKGELLIDVNPVIIPKNFRPDFIVLDSLTAIASAFTGREDSYRIYIEQLFRFFERLGCTTFLITETEQVPKIYSTTGVEEFLADGVIVLYNIKRGDVRENAIEVLKMRGEKHQKKIVAMQITGSGIVIYPEQEVFGGLGE